jgi:urease beta subunit
MEGVPEMLDEVQVEATYAMTPEVILPAAGTLELRAGRARATIRVTNTGDRPLQVGSHGQFCEVYAAPAFDRATACGMCLDVAAGTAIRFDRGIERRSAGLRGKGRA